MATIQEVNSSIMFGNFTNEQLNSISQAVQFARNQLVKETRRSVTIGTKVSFVNSRTGRKEVGEVTGIKIKNLVIRVGMTNWRVPASMVSVEE